MASPTEHRKRLEQAANDAKKFASAIESLLQQEEADYLTISIHFDNLESAAKRGFISAYKIQHNQE